MQTASRIVAGAWCVVDARGLIVRATAPTRLGQVSLFWAAGRGSWSRNFDQEQHRPWPVHYAGEGPRPRLAEAI